MKRTRFAILLLVTTGLLAWPMVVSADTVSIGLQQGPGGIMTVATGTGAAMVTQAFGTFSNVHVSGQGQSTLATPDILLSDSISTSSSAPGTLNIFITDSGLTSPVGALSFLSSFTANTLPAGWTLTSSTLLSPTNALYSGTLLAGTLFTGIGTNTQTTFVAESAQPYSVTQEYSITATGAGDTNDTIDLSATPVVISTPEPSLLVVLGAGLIGLGWLKRS